MNKLLKWGLSLVLALAFCAVGSQALAERFGLGEGNTNGGWCDQQGYIGQSVHIKIRNTRKKCWKRMSHLRIEGRDANKNPVPGVVFDQMIGHCDPNNNQAWQAEWTTPANPNVYYYFFKSNKGVLWIDINNSHGCWSP